MPALAALGGTSVYPEGHAWPTWPRVSPRHEELVLDVLRGGWWFWGSANDEFAEKFAAFVGARYAVPAANGTVTLELACKALGLGPGDEVIVPALTWCASGQAPLSVNAITVFADVLEDTWCLDPAAVEAAITPRTRAILPVHLYGRMAEMDALLAIADRHGLAIVEDCAHQHGSQWRGKGAGSIGTVGSFSMQQSKVLTSGEGGAVTTNDEALYRRIRSYTHVWLIAEDNLEVNNLHQFGSNARLTEIQSALLLAGLETLPDDLLVRERNARHLDQALASVPGIEPLRHQPEVTRQSLYHWTANLRLADFGVSRDVVQRALAAEGVPTILPYEPVYKSRMFGYDPVRTSISCGLPAGTLNYRAQSFPVAEKISYEIGLGLTQDVMLAPAEDIERAAEAFVKVLSAPDELRKIAES
jgi:L-glutamine:2-deoxy-scyllo-inosose/3-amino-2,3-dideoxy-scyllo-inosose aminotransferase